MLDANGWRVFALPGDIRDRASFFAAVRLTLPLDPPLSSNTYFRRHRLRALRGRTRCPLQCFDETSTPFRQYGELANRSHPDRRWRWLEKMLIACVRCGQPAESSNDFHGTALSVARNPPSATMRSVTAADNSAKSLSYEEGATSLRLRSAMFRTLRAAASARFPAALTSSCGAPYMFGSTRRCKPPRTQANPNPRARG